MQWSKSFGALTLQMGSKWKVDIKMRRNCGTVFSLNRYHRSLEGQKFVYRSDSYLMLFTEPIFLSSPGHVSQKQIECCYRTMIALNWRSRTAFGWSLIKSQEPLIGNDSRSLSFCTGDSSVETIQTYFSVSRTSPYAAT